MLYENKKQPNMTNITALIALDDCANWKGSHESLKAHARQAVRKASKGFKNATLQGLEKLAKKRGVAVYVILDELVAKELKRK